ncbi:MAG: 2-oxoglutarate dehydrogenase E1 component [Bacteroidota bacterium]
MDKYSYLGNADIAAIEEFHERYLDDPCSIDTGWKKFFEGFEFARKNFNDKGEALDSFHKEFDVINLINGYRQRGHLFTKTNPVRERRKYTPTLDISNFGLDESDMDKVFQAGAQIGIGPSRLRDIIEHLKQTYCQSIGAEYMYIRSPKAVSWLREKMERSKNTHDFSANEKKNILSKLNQAVAFEQFLHTRFTGQKRFSLEGCETLIPALDAIIERGVQLDIEEFVIGMAHRGRLNVLSNIFNKSYNDIFSEFEGTPYDDLLFGGDVKYHLGYSSDVVIGSNKKIHLSLSANSSHLESVDPVVEGMTRAKIDNKYNGDYNKIAPILIHGDASIAGQGVVYEVVQMSQLDGYKTGGTIHIVINNQIGFTTGYLDGRSSTYCTDVCKVTLSPVFHVNADDVEAVVFVIRLAMEFRQEFHRDVFIDLLGYRKYGHSEGDEPKFTQPLLYEIIERHPNPNEIYTDKLLKEGYLNEGEAKKLEKQFKDIFQHKLDDMKLKKDKIIKVDKKLRGPWSTKRVSIPGDFRRSPETGVDKKTILNIGHKIVTLPGDKKIFRKIRKLFDNRRLMFENGKLDWAMGELLAYGTLLNEGFQIRFSGQDVERGTFSHRHSVINFEDGSGEYIPLNHISDKQARFEIYNSLLSEIGVLGFEYGYASVSPDRLIIWEAQFGDFSNTAQVIIDQYISSSEDKWMRQNGLVLLLPHGYEGQGPEHSNARMERYLQLCAEDNMQMVNCTSPANFFHVLRRQLHRDFRKPLVVFTPKSLLRHPECVSPLEDFTEGGFQEVIDDAISNPDNVNKVVFCSGKIFYELQEQKEKKGAGNIAIVRIEQLYPLPHHQLDKIISRYKNVKIWQWVQEEPENMGAWSHLLRHFTKVPLVLTARPASASPATGSSKAHIIEQNELFKEVFENS